MCRPNERSHKQHGLKISPGLSTGGKSILRRVATATGCAVILLILCVPILFSEAVGGWTRKYTSPSPIFSVNNMPDLKGKVAIVTGANTGIGYWTALELAKNGAEVVVAARSITKGQAAVSDIIRALDFPTEQPKVHFLQLDLASLDSVKEFARKFAGLGIPLHLLVLNAGIMKSPGAAFIGKNSTYGFETTADGFETHIGVNHIGHFYLTTLLLDELKRSAPSRVVVVSSAAEAFSHEEGMRYDLWSPDTEGRTPSHYEDGLAYGQSKLANVLFARELADRLEGSGVTAYSCHPGVIQTELSRYMKKNAEEELKDDFLGRWLGKAIGMLIDMGLFTAKDGALTQLHLATSPIDELVNGGFYHPIGKLQNSSHPRGQNSTLQKELWQQTERAIRSVKKSFL